MNISGSEPAAWENEYSRGGIPSSVRTTPSSSVVAFFETCLKDDAHGLLLDIGCGSGRNALYLARQGYEVVGVDFTASQIAALRSVAAKQRLASSVSAILFDLRKPWTFYDKPFDAAIDTFFFKHLVVDADINRYVAELGTALKSTGKMMISFAGRNDGYYAKFPIPGYSGAGIAINDPANQISSILYDPDEVIELFRNEFEVLRSQTVQSTNSMHGLTYSRETNILWLQRR